MRDKDYKRVKEVSHLLNEYHTREKPMTEYFTKDGVKIEVGMEVETPRGNKAKVVYIHDGEDPENILLEKESHKELIIWRPNQLTSVKKYNGYGLRWDNEVQSIDLGSNRKTFDEHLKRCNAFYKLISHPGCRPYDRCKDSFVMEYSYYSGSVEWEAYKDVQETPLCYDKPYPELEETFKQFLGV